MSHHKQQMKDWLATKEIVGGRVLAIGCKNRDGDYFRRFEPATITTVDVEPDFQPTFVADFNEPCYWGVLYDHILLLGLANYMHDPMMMLRNCQSMAAPGCTLWIYSSFIHPQHPPDDVEFLRYTPAFWRTQLPRYGFNIAEYVPVRVRDPEQLAAVFSGDGFRLAPGVDHGLSGHLIRAVKEG